MNESMKSVNGTAIPDDDSHMNSTLDIFIGLSVFGVVIFMANGLVFLLVFKQRSLRRKTNFFLISLAVSDISSGLIGIPLVVICNTFSINGLCKAMDISNKFLAISTILHLLSATIERYIKVLAPFHYRRLVTRRRVLLILAGIWLFSLTTPLLELAWNDKLEISRIYSITLLCCFVVFPLLVMTFMTMHIFYIIRQQKQRFRAFSNRNAAQKQRRRKQAERRATVVYSAMSLSFALSWFPYFYLSHLSDDGGFSLPPGVNVMFLFMKFSSGLVDPLLYTFFKTDFQTALKSMLTCSAENVEVTIPLTLIQSSCQQTQRSSSE